MEDRFAHTIDSQQLAIPRSAGVSEPPVRLVEGSKPRLSKETGELLRRRLKAATLVLALTMLVTFVRTLFGTPDSLIWLRLLILITLVASCGLLHSRWTLTLGQLRIVELVVFGAISVQLVLVVSDTLVGSVTRSELPMAAKVATVTSVYVMNLAAWTTLIFIYGIFMPNTWKRAALVLFPAACVPYLVVLVHSWRHPEIGEILALDEFGMPVPIPFLAAGAAVYAAHIIHTARREAFKAKQLGQYRLKRKLGSGGMGDVFEAEHMLLKRPCAIKLIREDRGADPKTLARFELEVKATAGLSHWNTVEIYDYGHTDDGTFYYVMELLPGQSLDEIVKQNGPMPAARVVHFMRQTCAALREAHASGLIHRDIKPANIFAAERGGVYDVTKLLDFGLVRQMEAGENPGITMEGGVVGTPLFMSPEHVLSDQAVTASSDLYSLGAVAYYLLTGRPTFVGNTPTMIMVGHCRDEPEPPSKYQADIPPDVEQIVLKCLAKKPEDRYPDAAALERAWAECSCADDWSQNAAESWWKSRFAAIG